MDKNQSNLETLIKDSLKEAYNKGWEDCIEYLEKTLDLKIKEKTNE